MVSMKEFAVVCVLFVVLSPGVVLHLPIPDEDGNYVVFNSGKTSLSAVLFHAVVFGLLYAAVKKYL